jgi:hypothetical protein
MADSRSLAASRSDARLFARRGVWVARTAQRRLALARSEPDYQEMGRPGSIATEPSLPPCFVLSAGWRSGSTALQRLLSSSHDMFVWGEPYTTGQVLARLERMTAEALGSDYGQECVIDTTDIGPGMSARWMATTYPPTASLLTAARAYLNGLFWEPLAPLGYRSWGLKEVNLRAAQTRLLQNAFPDASYVFLVRHPVAAYRSFRAHAAMWPAPARGHRARLTWVSGPVGFGRVWLDGATYAREQVTGRSMVVRYEDAVADAAFAQRLSSHVGVEVDESAWKTRVGSSGRRPTRSAVERAEIAALWSVVGREAERWSYKRLP